MSRLRIAALTGAGTALLGGATAAVIGFGGPSSTPAPTRLPPATAEITTTTLVDSVTVNGTLGYGATTTVTSSAGADTSAPARGPQGTITWLPRTGDRVTRGQQLYRLDDRPITLLYGAIPAYRTLEPGCQGRDVEQFETNLRDLGYSGFTVDDTYSEATADAVRRWQDALDVSETGRVEPADVVYAADAVRIDTLLTPLGTRAGEPVLSYTSPNRVVTVDLGVADQRLAVAGAPVTLTLPGGATTQGAIDSVGAVAAGRDIDGGGGGPQSASSIDRATVQVVVSIPDQQALGGLEGAPVDVRLAGEERKDVLAVPVSALLALTEGGFGVEVVDGTTTRIVAVQVGLFTGGRVQVTSGELRAGMRIGVPR